MAMSADRPAIQMAELVATASREAIRLLRIVRSRISSVGGASPT